MSKEEQTAPYFVYRLLAIPDSQAQMLFPEEYPSKETLVNSKLEGIVTKGKKVMTQSGKRKYIIYPGHQKSDKVLRFKIARSSRTNIETEGDLDIEIQEINRVEHINVIYYKKEQILLFQNNTSVFTNIDIPRKYIEKYLQKQVESFNLSIKIDPIPSAKKFWDKLENADKIYSFEIKINQLNIAGGDANARELLKQLKEDVNDDEIKITVSHELGLINKFSNFIRTSVDYIGEIGGLFSLKYGIRGSRRKFKFNSKDVTKNVNLQKDIDDETDQNIINKIDNPDTE